MVTDPYAVLGIPKTATKEEVKKAYRSMAKKYHPDLHPNDPAAAEKMNEINEAYDMINNPAKYERRAAQQGQQSYQRGYTNQGGNYREYHYDSSSDDPWSDIFSQMFGDFYGGGYYNNDPNSEEYRRRQEQYRRQQQEWQRQSANNSQGCGSFVFKIIRIIIIINIVSLLLGMCSRGSFFTPFYNDYYYTYPGYQQNGGNQGYYPGGNDGA